MITAFKRRYVALSGMQAPNAETSLAHVSEVLRIAAERRDGNETEALRQYVSALPEVRQRCREVVAPICAMRDTPVTEQVVEYFSARLAMRDPDYNPEELVNEVLSWRPQQGDARDRADEEARALIAAGSASSDHPAAYQPAHTVDSSAADAFHQQAYAAEDAAAAAAVGYGRWRLRSGIQPALAFVAAWEEAAGRRMTAIEFMHHHLLADGGPPAPAAAAGLFAEQSEAFSQAADAHLFYTEAPLSEQQFVDMYVDRYKEPDFQAALVADIICGAVYRSKMEARIQAEYTRMFGVGLHPDDLARIFSAVQQRRLALGSDDLARSLVRANERFEGVRFHVTEAFNAVLRRDPEEEEVRDNMARFLPDVASQAIDEEGHWDCSCAVTALMHDLVTCIEFHDVVKQRLGEAAKRAGVPLRPKRIYELLSALLAENAARPACMLNDEPYDEAVRRSDARRT